MDSDQAQYNDSEDGSAPNALFGPHTDDDAEYTFPAASWTCSHCGLQNNGSASSCIACFNHQNSISTQQNQPNNDDDAELTIEEKLVKVERANDIYRSQMRYMQDHLASLRSLIQDKENIIENLTARLILSSAEKAIAKEMMHKNEQEWEERAHPAEDNEKGWIDRSHRFTALAQRTILENFELREMVHELRDENFHLRNEIYELQDTINRQVLNINKLVKQTGGAVDDEDDKDRKDPYETRLQELRDEVDQMMEIKAENWMIRAKADYILRIEGYMGMSIYDMIPRRLNNECKRVFQRLFSGYTREIEGKYVFTMKVPLLVTQLISYYYPWFL